MNPHVSEFLSTLEERHPADGTALAVSDWIVQHTTLRGKDFDFKGFEFQRKIVDDMHPDLCCIKLSQVGLTEVQLRKFFAFLKRHVGTSGIFSLPNQPMRDRLSQTRIKVLIENNRIFNGPMTSSPVRQKGLYQVDDSFGYITGTTEGEATSISADILFEDEVDLADQSMRSLFLSRLQGSSHKIRQKFSTPTYYGFGIDQDYSSSDQFEYFYRCPSCNHHQIPSFERKFLKLPGLTGDFSDMSQLGPDDVAKIDMKVAQLVCEKCSSPVDLSRPALREWVARHPGRNSRGYRVRPFSTSIITIEYIFRMLLEYHRKGNIKGWWNTVIGEPYNDSNARISEEDIRACMAAPGPIPGGLPDDGSLFLGCDVGQTCHVTIGRPNAIFEWRQIPQSEIKDFIVANVAKYNIAQGAIDYYPYTPLSEAIRDATGGIVMPAAYSTSKTPKAIDPHKNEFDAITHYVINRTMALDAVARLTRNHLWEFHNYGVVQGLLVTHLRDMIRIEAPDIAPRWDKINGDDHFLHSLALHQTAVRLRAGLDFSTDPRTSVLIMGGPSILGDKSPPVYRGADQAQFAGVLG